MHCQDICSLTVDMYSFSTFFTETESLFFMRQREKEYPQSYFGILAILTLGPQTGYDIRKVLEGPELFYWKESYGNIYPMLRILQNDGLIDKTDSYVKTKKKVIYQLNSVGMQCLENWLQEPATLNRFRVEILMKLRFGRTAGVANMVKQITGYKDTARQELTDVNSIIYELQSSAESLDTDLRLVSALFMKHLKEFSLLWCDESLGILEKWKNREPQQVITPQDNNDMGMNMVTVPARDLPLME